MTLQEAYRLQNHRAFRVQERANKKQWMILGPSPVKDKYLGYVVGSDRKEDVQFLNSNEDKYDIIASFD